jgi:hypothetical protein
MKVTVIIPTRERCDTLAAALRTCVHQRYDDLTILVSDNCSSDGTADVVKSFADRRIRYLNTGRRLAMTANWEFALSHVDEGYVTIIGDDDGLLPDAIADVARLLAELGRPPLLGWTKAIYHWPSVSDLRLRNLLTVPLGSTVVKQDARAALRELMYFQRSYGSLPGLYNAVADVQLIRAIQRQSGAFFHSSSPDVYSAVALTAAVDHFYVSLRPYGIGGQSAHSTGTSSMEVDKDTQSFQRFLSEGNLPFHEQLIRTPSLPVVTAEGYLQARDHYAPTLGDFDLARTLAAALAEAAVGAAPRYRETLTAVRAMAARHQLNGLAETLELRHPHREIEYEPPLGYNPLRGTIAVRADAFAAHDVFDASLLARHLSTLHTVGYFGLPGVLRTTVMAGMRSVLRRVRRLAASPSVPIRPQAS